ncbi:MAG: molybdopterin molybdotransferase MoeA [Methanospirillum sp.]|nr:molybdopterin molybdotransferase MoeA [Methanospirillum sp.]
MPRILSPENLIPMKEAQKLILSSFYYQPKTRNIPVKNAAGLILAEPVLSQRTIPPAPLAGPDGIAVKSRDTKGVSIENPREIEAIRVNTGLPLPAGYDAVIPVEEFHAGENGGYIISSSVSPQQNTVPKGADVIKDQEIVEAGHLLTSYDVAALAGFGIRNVMVKSWKIGLIATGDEVIPLKKEPLPGQIVDTNTMMISGYLNGYGVLTEVFPIIPDDPEIIGSQLNAACESCDMVLLFGGSSAGSKDYTVDGIEKSGKLLFHGVAMGPGKPVSCGLIQGKPVIGMPGPAIACLITFYQLVFPLLKSWGVPIPPKKNIIGEVTMDLLPFNGFDIFHLTVVRYECGKIYIVPLERRFGQSMGIRADAILHIARGSSGYRKGEKVQVTLIR